MKVINDLVNGYAHSDVTVTFVHATIQLKTAALCCCCSWYCCSLQCFACQRYLTIFKRRESVLSLFVNSNKIASLTEHILCLLVKII